jgi:hypothetical protein
VRFITLNIVRKLQRAQCGPIFFNVRLIVCINIVKGLYVVEYNLGVERIKDRAGDFWMAAATNKAKERLSIVSLLQDPFKELPQASSLSHLVVHL